MEDVNMRSLHDVCCRRKLEDLTIGPVLTWTTKAIMEHQERLLQIPGAAR